MDYLVPPHYVKSCQQHLDDLLACRNYFRDGWANGIEYKTVGSKEPFAFQPNDGTVYVDAGK